MWVGAATAAVIFGFGFDNMLLATLGVLMVGAAVWNTYIGHTRDRRLLRIKEERRRR